jgi:hypothetical protein
MSYAAGLKAAECARRILQSPRDASISGVSPLETGEDLHDYVFADRPRASEVYTGCLRRHLRAFSDSIDRADTPNP